MTPAFLIQVSPAIAAPWGSKQHRLPVAILAVARCWSNRREARRLAGLDDRMLADLGIARRDVHFALQVVSEDPTVALARAAASRRLAERVRMLAPISRDGRKR